MPKFINLAGVSFGNWTVLDKFSTANKRTIWLCRCKCGTEKMVNSASLRRGLSLSCGCLFPIHNLHHGLNKHPLYRVWKGIIQRCTNPNNPRAANYSKRGVSMCPKWRNDFKTFYDWAIANGWKCGLQIDKDIIPKKLGIPALLYSPEMCCFVTPKINAQNSTAAKLNVDVAEEIRGSKDSNRNLADKYGVHIDTIGLIKRNKIWI